MKGALCNGSDPAIFFEDAWRHKVWTKQLEKARGFCDSCPVRAQCLAEEMKAEAGMPVDHRIGIFGGMTGAQRHSLEKRGTEYRGLDPVEVRATIPDRGDAWTDRHTALAREVITWLVENVEPDAEVPTAAALARKMSARVVDMRRVYQALIEDQVIRRDDTGTLLRKSAHQSAKNWLPRHLRCGSLEPATKPTRRKSNGTNA
jgi:Transcription factor WhiB